MKRIAIVLGTRPEAIKMSPVVRASERQDVGWFMVHTGQDQVFSGGLGLPDAKDNPDVGSESWRHWSCQTIVPLAADCYIDDVVERFRTSCCIR